MKRVTEPELMLEPDQVQAYSEADFSLTDSNAVFRLAELVKDYGLSVNSKTLIIDLGCGPGNITERLAQHWPQAQILGIDGSSEMLRVAKQSKNIKKNISYRLVDILSIADGNYDLLKTANVVFSNSLLHHIHCPNNFVNALLSISKRGTIHFHRDLRRPLTSRDAISIQKKYLGEAPSVLKKDFLASLHAAYTVNEIEDFIRVKEFESFKVSEVDDRYLDITGIVY